MVSFRCVAHVMRVHVLPHVSIRFVKPLGELLQVKQQMKQFRNCFKSVKSFRIIPWNMVMFSFIWESFIIIFYTCNYWGSYCKSNNKWNSFVTFKSVNSFGIIPWNMVMFSFIWESFIIIFYSCHYDENPSAKRKEGDEGEIGSNI